MTQLDVLAAIRHVSASFVIEEALETYLGRLRGSEREVVTKAAVAAKR